MWPGISASRKAGPWCLGIDGTRQRARQIETQRERERQRESESESESESEREGELLHFILLYLLFLTMVAGAFLV